MGGKSDGGEEEGKGRTRGQQQGLDYKSRVGQSDCGRGGRGGERGDCGEGRREVGNQGGGLVVKGGGQCEPR